MIAEDILYSYVLRYYLDDLNKYKDEIIEMMKEYAKLMCEKQREICAESIEDNSVCWNKDFPLHQDSIINSPLPEELQ